MLNKLTVVFVLIAASKSSLEGKLIKEMRYYLTVLSDWPA